MFDYRHQKTKNIERWYRRQLREIAEIIGIIAKKPHDELSAEDRIKRVISDLFNYSAQIHEWSNRVADLLVKRCDAADLGVWMHTGKRINRETRKTLQDVSVSPIFTRLQREQVVLITSLPLEASKRVHEWSQEAMVNGERFDTVIERIETEIGTVTESRARLIARTECARVRANFMQARAQAIGSTGYIWHTSNDGYVRDSHKVLDGTVQRWDSPPVTDVGRGGKPIRSHPSCVFNCRCFAEPLFPE